MAIGNIATPVTWITGTVVTPAFQQSVEDNINAAIAGTMTLKSLRLDGTGGAVTTSTSGGILMSGQGITTFDIGSATGGALPVPRGAWGRDSLPFAWATINSGPGAASPPLYYGQNITSVARTGAGNYTVTLSAAMSSVVRSAAFGSAPTLPGSNAVNLVQAIIASTTTISIRCINLNPTGPVASVADMDCSFILYCGT